MTTVPQTTAPPTVPQQLQTYYALMPTRKTLFLRRFLPWQIIRFIVINIRMTIMLVKGHSPR